MKDQKHRVLENIIGQFPAVIVAYSGGVDSALVLKLSYDVLKDQVVAFTADSPAVPRKELEIAQRIAQQIGAEHVIVQTKELQNPNYATNPQNRCYFCKSELYTVLSEFAASRKIHTILNGTNADDLRDYRPGLRAAHEYQVLSPLAQAGMTKQDVRILAKTLGLEIWDKPASPCLASRIPYGQQVTAEKLHMIEQAEQHIRETYGIQELRVRHFGNIARIELPKTDIERVQVNSISIRESLSKIGFQHITFAEFKSGSLNILA